MSDFPDNWEISTDISKLRNYIMTACTRIQCNTVVQTVSNKCTNQSCNA